jgi:hypothetical protein
LETSALPIEPHPQNWLRRLVSIQRSPAYETGLRTFSHRNELLEPGAGLEPGLSRLQNEGIAVYACRAFILEFKLIIQLSKSILAHDAAAFPTGDGRRQSKRG